jgi:hypothetical protein
VRSGSVRLIFPHSRLGYHEQTWARGSAFSLFSLSVSLFSLSVSLFSLSVSLFSLSVSLFSLSVSLFSLSVSLALRGPSRQGTPVMDMLPINLALALALALALPPPSSPSLSLSVPTNRTYAHLFKTFRKRHTRRKHDQHPVRGRARAPGLPAPIAACADQVLRDSQGTP